MKEYKKVGLLLGIVIFSNSPIIMNAITKQAVKEELQRGADVFFYRLNPARNLFDRTGNMEVFYEELGLWTSALQSLHNYVRNNAGDNPQLLRASNFAREVGSRLAETIVSGRNVRLATNDAEKLARYKKLESNIEYLLSTQKDLNNTINSLLNIPWWTGNRLEIQKKIEVRNLLAQTVLPMLERVIERVMEDYRKVSDWVPRSVLVNQIMTVYPKSHTFGQ